MSLQSPTETKPRYQRMKSPIVLVIGSLAPGGAERQLSIMASYLAAEGRQVVLVTLRRVAEELQLPLGVVRLSLADRPRNLSANSRVLGRLSAARDLVIAVWRLRRLLIALKPRTALGFLDISNLVLLAASVGLPIRVVVSDRNDPDHHHRNTWLLRCVKRVFYARASLFVAQTESAAVRAGARYRIQTAVVPNVLLVSPNSSSCRLNQISSLGRLVPIKGQRTLLRAFAQSRAPSLGWGLVVAGTGPDLGALKSLAVSLGIARFVEFIPRVNNPVDLYSSSGIFVLSSNSEGFPNVLLEAMACACPVIATDCPSGPSDLIEHGRSGLLVPVGDIQAMAHAIDVLVGDQELRVRLGDCAAVVASLYSKESIMPRWNAVITQTT